MQYTILNGYFWENLFFFITEDKIYLLISEFFGDETILLELATNE